MSGRATKRWGRISNLVVMALFTNVLFTGTALASGKPARVAILLPGDEWAKSVDGLKEGMKELGYNEGRDVHYLFENAKGDKAKVAELARRFVAEKVALLFTITNTALKVVAQETKASRLPVVFGSASGPVESGIVPAYVTPNTHITGVTSGSIELVAKRLEIIREIFPKIKRVAAIGDADSDSSKMAFTIAAQAAAKLRLRLIDQPVGSKDEALAIAGKLTTAQTDALFLVPGLHGVGAMSGIAAAAMNNRMPFAVYQVEHVKKDGALLSYGSSYYLQGKQSASMVDKVLRSVPVHQIPIERPLLHELVLNLDTARRIGVRFPPEVIHRAGELVGNAQP